MTSTIAPRLEIQVSTQSVLALAPFLTAVTRPMLGRVFRH